MLSQGKPYYHITFDCNVSSLSAVISRFDIRQSMSPETSLTSVSVVRYITHFSISGQIHHSLQYQ